MTDDDFEAALVERRIRAARIAGAATALLTPVLAAATAWIWLVAPLGRTPSSGVAALMSFATLATLAAAIRNVRELRALQRGDLEAANAVVLDGVAKATADGEAYLAWREETGDVRQALADKITELKDPDR